MIEKAADSDFKGRFREIVSDPLNQLILRVPEAGTIRDGLVCLHNGNKVPSKGRYAYYENFSDILIINRGVHEPLEEYIFQELMKVLPSAPTMVELGAYWAHYSMWLKKERPEATTIMVEPSGRSLKTGKNNFLRNGYSGEFIRAFVGKGKFTIDNFMSERSMDRLDILHSDIQGFEGEMLEGAENTLRQKQVDYIFVSTHSAALHQSVVTRLTDFGYRIEASSDFDHDTTSYDGLVFASHPDRDAVLKGYAPLGREEILATPPAAHVERLSRMVGGRK
jgi:hypothetical protein